MSATVLYMSMSLDGFVAGPNEGPGNGLGDGGDQLHAWFWPAGETDHHTSAVAGLTGANRAVVDEMMATGAVVAGRRTFELAGGWAGDHHSGVPVFIYSRQEPGIDISGWPLVSYLPDVRQAITAARQAAGERDVLVHGVATTQLALGAGLLDELVIHLVPVLLGSGTRLFGDIVPVATQLRRIGTREGEHGVTHLHYRVQH